MITHGAVGPGINPARVLVSNVAEPAHHCQAIKLLGVQNTSLSSVVSSESVIWRRRAHLHLSFVWKVLLKMPVCVLIAAKK